jgi:hypothetical protein
VQEAAAEAAGTISRALIALPEGERALAASRDCHPLRSSPVTETAVGKLAEILRDYGPPILVTPFVHGKTVEQRLQAAPDARHIGDDDPHRSGRALDIVLLAADPAQKAEGDALVQIFRDLADDMQWGWLIYNKRQWSPSGSETPRTFRAQKAGESAATYAFEKASFEHVTHIHIEWEKHKREFVDYEDSLVSALSQATAKLGALDMLTDALDGTWDANIGDWNGQFKFTRDGTASWFGKGAKTPGGKGRWNADTANELRFHFGDARTFTVRLPIDPKKASGTILPAGQGWFSMSKA